MNRLTLILLIIACISSCDPGVVYLKTIDNRSSYRILIEVFNAGSKQDSAVVEPHTSSLVHSLSSLGSNISSAPSCARSGFSFVGSIIGNSSLRITKDFNLESNWTSKIKKQGAGSGTQNCTLTITDDDIQ